MIFLATASLPSSRTRIIPLLLSFEAAFSFNQTTIDGLRPRAHYLDKLIREHFPADKNAAILDLGCGHGALVHFARQTGYYNIKGVDRSPQQVAEAQRLGIDGVSEGDLLQTLQSLGNSSQDMIITFDVIEHFTKNELIPFTDEVYRVLRKGGKWIIHTPNAESPFFGRIRYGDFTHEQAFTRTSIIQLLKSSGFSNIICYEDTPIPHGLKSAIRWLLWKVIRGGLRLYLAVETGAGEKACIFSQNFLVVVSKII
jgi:2-polyprenyl-3-methyl-5-hydroxy-6-metoxy-1,4-benzoquinol methylase